MCGSDDVTQWILRLADGDGAAAQVIWERYFDKLVRLARRKLECVPRRVVDEEDVALSAMASFCRGAAAGRFPELTDRQDLWKLLVTITARKAVAQIRRHYAQKRGAGDVRGESAFLRNGDSEAEAGIAEIFADEPTQQFADSLSETCRMLLARLEDETLKAIALYRMEGYSNKEIGQKLGCVERTVERKLARIRQIWEREKP
jgi:RNA polymerase sigma factor (sigma-70 family)